MADITYEEFCDFKNVSRETFLKMENYIELLKKWQKTINLVSPTTLPHIWKRHIIDSVQLVDYIKPQDKVADIGSGAGFPGLILALLGIEDVTLIESDTRKIAFLREAAREIEVKINLVNKRVEEVSLSNFLSITARAFAPLDTMLGYMGNTLTSSARLLLLKGKNYEKEIESAKKNWEFNYKAFPSITDNDGVILSIHNLRKQGN